MQINITKNIKLSAVQILAIGFATVIMIGAVLLSLPVSTIHRTSTPFIDSFFTATSAVCVTGLVVVDTGTHWSYFGKTVILFLIQIGGLGFMSFATLFALILGKKITLRERLVMQEAMNSFNLQGLVKMARYILVFTFSVELIGALLLATQFIPEYGFGKGIYFSIFHSVSAFCNAGFDIFGYFRSLTIYPGNTVVMLTISSLVIVGGLGFYVWADLYNYKSIKKLSLHTKVVLVITLSLIVVGAVLFFIFEYYNPATLNQMSFKNKIVNSLFASITPRTAGFNSIQTVDMTMQSRFLTIMLMFIGGSPGSTAGGIKTATFGIILFTVISRIRGKEDTEVFMKRISQDQVMRSFMIFTLGLTIVILLTIMLAATESGVPFEHLLFESTSAFGTAGLSLGLTTSLSRAGKILISIAMYFGRVGPLTVALALSKNKVKSLIRYPEDKILVG
jgi:trk system potassium uptake protein